MFIAQSAIETILPQLPAICDRLGVDKFHRDGFFRAGEPSSGEVTVKVGEINWEGDFVLLFRHGNFVGHHEERWGSGGDVNQSEFKESP